MAKKIVLVGMSGGVDSSAAAALLCDKGYEVCGCTLKMYDNSVLGEGYGEGGCCSLADVDDARSVCRKLGIDHITLNFTDEFGKHVMKPFADSYIKGETPNPCIECNSHLKFDLMLRRAMLLEFDYIATGHYADIALENGRYLLKRPADRRKDQTYVLYTLTQEQLAHTLFPLYGTDKPAIRQYAEERGLINSRKPDSQDICFVPDGDYAAFIKRYTGYEPKSGYFIDNSGNKIGTHSGIINYTIGQRRGLGVTFGKPVFVTAKDPERGTVTLSDEPAASAASVSLSHAVNRLLSLLSISSAKLIFMLPCRPSLQSMIMSPSFHSTIPVSAFINGLVPTARIRMFLCGCVSACSRVMTPERTSSSTNE